MEESIFQAYIGTKSIFRIDREILRPSYIPEKLPHRETQIEQLAQILVPALKGEPASGGEPREHLPDSQAETAACERTGCYFVLGDNRPNSSDSRQGWLLPAENILGFVVMEE